MRITNTRRLSIWYNPIAGDFWVLIKGKFWLLRLEGEHIPGGEPIGFVKVGDVKL